MHSKILTLISDTNIIMLQTFEAKCTALISISNSTPMRANTKRKYRKVTVEEHNLWHEMMQKGELTP